MDETQRRINQLNGEVLALNLIIGHVLGRVVRISPAHSEAVRLGFDEAANQAEHIAIKFGESAAPEHTVEALRIVEELRLAIFGH